MLHVCVCPQKLAIAEQEAAEGHLFRQHTEQQVQHMQREFDLVSVRSSHLIHALVAGGVLERVPVISFPFARGHIRHAVVEMHVRSHMDLIIVVVQATAETAERERERVQAEKAAVEQQLRAQKQAFGTREGHEPAIDGHIR